MRKYLYLLIALCIPAAFATSINFAWDPGADYPPGTTYDLYANEASTTGITSTTQSLDVVGAPGEPLSAGVRAVPPAGYQCGDPLVECQPSVYATLDTLIPGDVATIPLEQYGGCATAEEIGGAMGAPTPISQTQTAWNTSTDPKTTASIAVQVGDVLVAAGSIENGGTNGEIGISDSGGLTWTQRQEYGQNIQFLAYVSLWTAVADANESITVTFDRLNGLPSDYFGGVVKVFRGSDGVGATNIANNGSGSDAPSVSVTTTQDNSALVAISGDWNAVTGTSTWTSTAGTPTEVVDYADGEHYGVHSAYYADVGAIGAKTVGMSAPSTQRYAIAVVEVKGAAGGTTETGELSEAVAAASTHGLIATARPVFTGTSSAAHSKRGQAQAIGALSRSALAQDLLTGRYIGVGALLGASNASILTAAGASAFSRYADSAQAAAIKHATAQAMAQYLSHSTASASNDGVAFSSGGISAPSLSGEASHGAATKIAELLIDAYGVEFTHATATALSEYRDATLASETPPSRAQAIAAVIAQALASDAHDSDLGTVLGQLAEGATTSDVFNAVATAYAALALGVQGGEQWVNTVAAGGNLSALATATEASAGESFGAQDGTLSEAPTQAFSAFLGAVNALAGLSQGVSAQDVVGALVGAAGSIAEATTASDVYDTLSGDTDRALTEGATAGEASTGQASAFERLIASIFATDAQSGTGAAGSAVSGAASSTDAYQATLSDLERAISEGAAASESSHGKASVYSALVEAISAATAINAQVATVAGFVAGALAGDSFSISDVEDARIERLYIAAISVTRAIDATLGISSTITGTVSIN